jgi:hypothetical protein
MGLQGPGLSGKTKRWPLSRSSFFFNPSPWRLAEQNAEAEALRFFG